MQFPHNNNVNTSSAPPALLDITSVPRRNESMVSFSKITWDVFVFWLLLMRQYALRLFIRASFGISFKLTDKILNKTPLMHVIIPVIIAKVDNNFQDNFAPLPRQAEIILPPHPSRMYNSYDNSYRYNWQPQNSWRRMTFAIKVPLRDSPPSVVPIPLRMIYKRQYWGYNDGWRDLLICNCWDATRKKFEKMNKKKKRQRFCACFRMRKILKDRTNKCHRKVPQLRRRVSLHFFRLFHGSYEITVVFWSWHVCWQWNGRVFIIYAALQAHQLARDPQQARGESRDIMLVRLSFGQSESVPNDKLMLLQYFPPPERRSICVALQSSS